MPQETPIGDEARRVLIVEDEPQLRDLLARMCRELGFESNAVGSGEAALSLLRDKDESTGTYKLLIIDLNLPAMDGLTFLEKVREMEQSNRATEKNARRGAIILTGFGDLDAAQKAIRLDVADFLTKPCHLGELETALDRALRRYEDSVAGLTPLQAYQAAMEEEDESIVNIPKPEAGQTIEKLEREAIEAALERNDGNRRATAEELGISLRTLYYRLSRYQSDD